MPTCCICIYGLVKTNTREQMDTWTTQLLTPLRDAGYTDVDALLHSYDLPKYTSTRSKEVNAPLMQQEAIEMIRDTMQGRLLQVSLSKPEEADQHELFQPTSFFLQHGDPWPDNRGEAIYRYFRQLYSLDSVSKMLRDTKTTYDLVIFMRPDTFFVSALLKDELVRVLEQPNTIGIPKYHSYGGYNDAFAFGAQQDMLVYGTRVHGLRDYVGIKKKPPHAETYLKVALDDHSIKVLGTNHKVQVIRSNGQLDGARRIWR